MSQGRDVAAAAAVATSPDRTVAAASSAAAISRTRRRPGGNRDMKTSGIANASPSGSDEVLVGAGTVLARPLIELLSGVVAGTENVQAQATVLVLELPRT